MFGRKSLFTAIAAIVSLFTGCTEIYDQEASIVISTTTSYSTTVNGVSVRISPSTVALGEEVSIDVAHEDSIAVDVIINSKSLSYQKNITTPYSTKMRRDIVGSHALSFSFEIDGMEAGVVTNVKVTE